MSFRKHRLDSASSGPLGMKKISKKFVTLPRKNILSRIVLGSLAIMFFFFVSFSVLANLPKDGWSFDLLGAVGRLTLGAGSDYDPGKPIVNVLLTGRGGGDHDAPDLTDTIMLASMNLEKKSVSFFSIPRDLYVKYPTGGSGRINEVFMRAANRNKNQEEGIKALASMVEKITGQPIDFYVGVDFMGFIKAVDVLGGITVDVPEKFVDTQYPDGNWGYTTFSLDAGAQLIDGATALKYARSRHSTSDFDRSLRQQEILRAIKEQAFSVQNLVNPAKIRSLYLTLSEHIVTDLSIEDILYLANFVRGLDSSRMVSFNLSDSCFQGFAYCERGGLLYTPQRAFFNNMSVLLPDGASPSDIEEYARIQTYAELASRYSEMFLSPRPVYVVNSTSVGGVAGDFALMLRKYGFTIPDSGGLLSNKDREKKTTIFYTLPSDPDAEGGVDGREAVEPVSESSSVSETTAEPENAISASGSSVDGATAVALPDEDTIQALSLFFFVPIQQVDVLPDAPDAPPGSIEILIGADYDLFLNK
ncbi:MAG TPA: LCP family protein [bacterium]|nr:LCP family protein [bacterium]